MVGKRGRDGTRAVRKEMAFMDILAYLRKPHGIATVAIVIFAAAWAAWSFLVW